MTVDLGCANSSSFDFKWTIKNYLALQDENASVDFSPPGSKDVWVATISKYATYGYFYVQLCLKKRGDEFQGDVVAMAVVKAKFKSIDYGISCHSYTFKVGTAVGVTQNHHGSLQTHTNYGQDLELFITLIYKPTEESQTTEREGSTSLFEDFKAFVSGGVNAFPPDFKLIASDGAVKAYKWFLVMRSDVFRAMLENEMQEKEKNQVELKDFNKETLEHFTKFLTTDSLSEDIGNCAADLYILADKYKVISLVSKCEVYLAENATVQNSARLLALVQQIPSVVITRKLFKLLNP